jgi:DNA-binding cell septation regulator SpoVG
MIITDVKVKKVYTDPVKPVKAKVAVVIDNELVLHNIRVIEKVQDGTRKKFLAFPSQKVTTVDENNNPQSGFYDIYHPINADARVKFETAIYKAIDEYIAKEAK